MLAKQISRNKEIYCTIDAPLTEVFQKMMEQDCDCMPVVESPTHRNIIGTITEHDICLKIVGGGLSPQRTGAGRVMNGNFTTVGGDASVDECLALMSLTGAERLFVVDENGAFLGILTGNDLKSGKPLVNLETVVTELRSASALPSAPLTF